MVLYYIFWFFDALSKVKTQCQECLSSNLLLLSILF